MRRWSRWIDRRALADESGAAALEFITVGLLMLVPLVYLVVALTGVQSQALGVESGARHIARALSLATDAADASDRGDAVLRTTVAEYGLDPTTTAVTVSCRPVASPCPAAGATVTVTVSARVPLPFVPAVFGWDRALSIPVEAAAVQKVSRLWGAQ